MRLAMHMGYEYLAHFIGLVAKACLGLESKLAIGSLSTVHH
jgi:hypothetical protein